MSCYCDIEPMKNPRDTLKRLCQQAADKVNRVENLTERERALLVCVLGIREFGWALRNSMDENGEVFAGFSESNSSVILLHGIEIWDLVDGLTECMLEGTGDLERFDPGAAESRRRFQAHLDEIDALNKMTEGVPSEDVQLWPFGDQ